MRILNQVGVDFEPEHSKAHFHQDETLQPCVTKFDEKKLRFRRALSFSGESVGSWVVEGEEDQHDRTREEEQFERQVMGRRYSFPVSPRTIEQIPERVVFAR